MIWGSSCLVIYPTANQAHPCFSIVHSLRGLGIECKDCIQAASAKRLLPTQIPPFCLLTNPKTGHHMTDLPDPSIEIEADDDGPAACVLVFNANDPSGAGGITADITAIASVGAHALPVITGAYARDTSTKTHSMSSCCP